MPEDRFGDLDSAGRRRGEAGSDSSKPRDGRGASEAGSGEAGSRPAERLAELDAQAEREREGPPPPARPGSRYGWVVGVAVLLVIAVAAVNTLPNSGRGREGPEPGTVLPDFAAASLRGDSEADANVRQGTGGSAEQGAVPACEVAEDDVVNICELRERPVVLTFVAPGCEEALDLVERVRPRFPGVSFVGVIIGESRGGVDDVAEGHDWDFPVALDPDNAVFNLYRAADCPTTITAEAGGEVAATRNGPLSAEELRAAVAEVAPARGGSA